MTVFCKGFLKEECWVKGLEVEGECRCFMNDLTVNSDYATLKQTAAERTMWRHSRGISRTCCTAED